MALGHWQGEAESLESEELRAEGERLVSVRGLSLAYEGAGRRPGKTVLDGVSLDIREGEFVVVLGASGSGKTSLLRVLAGYLPPSSGTADVLGKPAKAGAEVGVVFQQSNLFPWLTVRRNVEFGLRMRGMGRAERRETALAYLAKVGLSDVEDHLPFQLSGGMKQRGAIARALAASPRLLLMDEPFGALDAITREHLQTLVRTISREAGVTVFFITHDVDEALYLGSRIIVMDGSRGRISSDEPNALFGSRRNVSELRGHRDYAASRERLLALLGEGAIPSPAKLAAASPL